MAQTLDPTTLDPTAPKTQVTQKPAAAPAPASPALPVSTQPVSRTPSTPTTGQALPVAPAATSDPLAFVPTNNPQTGDAPPQSYGDAPTATPNAGNTLGGLQIPQYNPNDPSQQNAVNALQNAPNSPNANPRAPVDPSAGMTTAQFDASSPLSGLTEQQKAEYWAGQDTTGLAYGATPTGSTGDPNAGGSVSTYNPLQTAANDASLATAGKTDPAVQGVQGAQAAALSGYNATNQAGNDASNAATYAQLANGLNSQPGYAGSGLPLLDPTNIPPSWLGNGAAPGVGGAPYPSTANPLDAAHTAPSTAAGPGGNGTPPSGGTPGSAGNGQGVSYTYPSSGGGITPSTSGTSGSTLTGPVATAGPVNSQPTLTPLTPDNALTNSIISPNSNVDRFAVAKQQIQDEINNELEPQFNADSRTIAAQSFGAGRGVSGANRTAEGNLALQHSRDINQLTSSYLNPALTGTIQDTLNNANFAAGQQQFEAGQQNTAYNQQTGLQELADSENQQQFNQALQKLIVGSQGDPAQLETLLAQLYGGQSAQSSQAAQNLAKSTVS